MKITVIGAGYVGLVTAACLAEMGNSVVGLDVDAARVANLAQGILPIHEPGLDGLVRRNQQAARLRFTTDAASAIEHGSIVFIAVGTPPAEDGSADLAHVLAAASTVGQHMTDYKVIVNKSTVPVGTAEQVRATVAGALLARAAVLPFSVVSNPEFLKEGAAVDDFMSPDRVIVGADDDRALYLLRSLYAPFLRNRDRLLTMDPRSAELTKYASNAMLALRISFMNEMAQLADRVGADVEQVRQGMGADPRIGTHFLYAGCGWGGSCFPKDVKALAHLGRSQALPLQLLEATLDVNDRQRRLLGERVVQRFGPDLRGRRFAVWGLAFKPGTDDLREAPSRVLIDELLARGAAVAAHDPVAMPNACRQWADLPGLQLVDDPYDATQGADALLVVTEWRQFRSPDFDRLLASMATPVVFDGRNLYDPLHLRELGFEHWGIGRGHAMPARPPEVERLRA